jgi:hypothetical protein
MSGKRVAPAARCLKRRAPSARLRHRPHLEVLEDRTVLSPVTFNEVQSQSILTLSGSIAGRKIKAQGPGALTTTYFGTFEANVDEANGTIAFTQTGNDFCAADTGSWAPTADGGNGTAPAIYGFQVNIHHQALQAAIRDFHMNADTGGSTLPLYQNDDGSFGFPSAQTIAISAASGTYLHPTLGHGAVNFSGLHAPNQAADGQLVDDGHGHLVLTVPIDVSMRGTIAGHHCTLHITGQIVGTGTLSGEGVRNGPGIGVALVATAGAGGDATPAAYLPEPAPQGLPAAPLAAASPVPDDGPQNAPAAPAQPVAPVPVDQFTALDSVFQQLPD